MRVGIKISRIVFLGLFFSVISILLMPTSSYALEDVSWKKDSVQIEVSNDLSNLNPIRCINTQITVIDLEEGMPAGSKYSTNGCVYNAKTFQVATYRHKETGLYLTGIKLSSESNFTSLSNVVPQLKINVSSTSDRFSYYSYGEINHVLSSVKDLPSSIEILRRDSNGQPTMYRLKQGNVKNWFEWTPASNPIQSYKEVSSIAYSLNGRYAIAWIGYNGHVKIDFDLDTQTVVTDMSPGDGYVTVYTPTAAGITNDGQFAFIGPITSMVDTKSCGYNLTREMLNNPIPYGLGPKTNCTSSEYDLNSVLGYNGRGLNYEWVANEEAMRFTYNPWPHTNDNQRLPSLVTIRKKSGDKSKLDYLALGDSYSSGEGDTGKKADGSSYYTPNTSAVGGCHVSVRSYPFLLAQFALVPNERMQSVACSGARVSKDYYGSSDGYFGQKNQLKGDTVEVVAAKQINALKTFDPGIIKQVDFVRANKPKVVTLTGGGNDVGFSQFITYCALPSGISRRINTCDQAVPNTLQRAMLGDAIQGQYEKITALIQAIKQASESTTIYVIGYPSFVNETNPDCLNSVSLNNAERATINTSINYFNKVLAEASKAAGAKYVDIEESLNGGRICEGSKYVTGPLNVLGADIKDRRSEMFHPNSDGNKKMAEKIQANGFEIKADQNPAPQATAVPVKPATFGSSKYVPTIMSKLVSDAFLLYAKKVQFLVEPGLFAINKPVSISIWSSPKQLGSYKVGADGSLEATIKLPKSIKPGYHMIVAEGESKNGGLLRLYQYIEVKSDKANDSDDDGIKDEKDTCQYIKQWYDETSKKDVCRSKAGVPPGSVSGDNLHNPKEHDNHTNFFRWLSTL